MLTQPDCIYPYTYVKGSIYFKVTLMLHTTFGSIKDEGFQYKYYTLVYINLGINLFIKGRFYRTITINVT